MRTFWIVFFLLSLVLVLDARPPKRERLRSHIYDLEFPPLPQGEIAYVNGMNHKPERAIRCAEMLAELAGKHVIYTVYNPTDGFFMDIAKCCVELYNFRMTQPVRKLHANWNYFFATHPENEKLLQFCHSQGCIQVRNALLRYPPHLRKRIIVVAIAPAAYIPDFLCCEAFHYASRRDIVPSLDVRGRKRCRDKVVVLTPHPEAAFFDHHFLSPTYRPAIHHHLMQYLREECFFFCQNEEKTPLVHDTRSLPIP